MPELYKQIKIVPDINYISKDFDSLRRSLTEYIATQFPDTFSDFADVSTGMAILETVCYAGDILNFYLDSQFNELFLATAVEEKNIISLAKNMGYKPKGKAASQNNNLILKFNYPTSGSTTNFEFVIKKGARVSNKFGDSTFEFLHDIDTITSKNTKTIDIINNVTSASISGIKIAAGVSKTYQVKVGQAVPFFKLPLPDENIIEIISISSTNGHIWYEVDYLAQENQFIGIMNEQSSSSQVPYIMTLRRVPRRFVVEKEAGNKTFLRFGSGTLAQTDAEFIPNPEDFVIPNLIRGAISGFSPAAVDPSDFINTGTLGIAPANTVLVIKYRSGGGLKSNAAANIISDIVAKKIEYKTSGNIFEKSILESTMRVNNPEPCTGGEEEESIEQIRENASAYFATQLRCVTLQDYIVRSYTMPIEFGAVFRAIAMKDPNDKLGIKLAILSRNSDAMLVNPTDALKINLANYLQEFRSLSDNINITNGKIINLGLRFQIITDKTGNQQEILANCIEKLMNYFDIRKWNMSQSISISLVSRALTDVKGVLAVPDLSFYQLRGNIDSRSYSETQYNLHNRIKNYVITCDQDQIFEIKYPNYDILGSVIS